MDTNLTIQTPSNLLEEARVEMKRARAAKESYDLAEFMCRTALRDAENRNLPLAPAQFTLANIKHWQGDYRQAVTILEIALKESAPDALHVEMAGFLIGLLAASDRPDRACEVAREVSPLVEAVADDFHTGQFLRNYGDALNRLNEVDPAIERYTGAAIHFERAEDFRRCSDVRNNLACLLIRVGKLEEAHEQIKSALSFFHSDEEAHRSALGQVYETQATAYEAEGKLEDAFTSINRSLAYLLGGEEAALIKASRETHGRILDKLGVERVVALLALVGDAVTL